MKRMLTYLFTVFIFHFGSGQEINAEAKFLISNATYQVGKSYLEFDLSVENSSSQDITIIKPIPQFFENTYVFNVDRYSDLEDEYPYKLIVTKNRKCKNNEIIRMSANLNDTKKLDGNNLIDIPAGKTINLGRLKLDIENEYFCKKPVYKMSISYSCRLKTSYKIAITEVKSQLQTLKEFEALNNLILLKHDLERIPFDSQKELLEKNLKYLQRKQTLGKYKISSNTIVPMKANN